MNTLPPLNALRAFEAAGRHQSATRAAEELFVTHGAISKQIKMLEQHLGLELVRRTRSGLALTPEGLALLEQLSRAFENLSVAVRSARPLGVSGRVKVACMEALAVNWLIPKLGRFNARYTDISLTIVTPSGRDPFRDLNVDLAIIFGRPRWPHLHAELMKEMEFFPVCSPILLSGPNKIRRSSDLLQHVLLDDPEDTQWNDWFALVGRSSSREAQRLRLSDFNHTLAAARAALGIAMGDNVNCAADLADGTLVRPLKEVLRPKTKGYFILTPQSGGVSGPTLAFIEWLKAEASRNEV